MNTDEQLRVQRTDDTIFAVVRLSAYRDDHFASNATGFFYEHDRSLYLITNRHVVIDESEEYFPNRVSLLLHSSREDLTVNSNYSIPLYDQLHHPIWLEHSVHGSDADVVAIPLPVESGPERFIIQPFNEQNLMPEETYLPIGDDLLVIGYPLGISDEVHNLPIIRTAAIASVHTVPFEGKPYFLVDSRLHAGTSGAPVTTRPTGALLRRDGILAGFRDLRTFLVGVHAATFTFPGEESGLNQAWLARLVPEIIETGVPPDR